MDWDKHNDLRAARIHKYNEDQKINDKEVWAEVKRYYKEIEQYALDKKEREKEIMDRLVAYYNAASGAKADELRKRAEAIIASIEEGQVKNRQVLEKLEQR